MLDWERSVGKEQIKSPKAGRGIRFRKKNLEHSSKRTKSCYQPREKQKHAATFLRGFNGWLHAEDTRATQAARGIIRVGGCWAHARRKFDEALQTLPKEKQKDSRQRLANAIAPAIQAGGSFCRTDAGRTV